MPNFAQEFPLLLFMPVFILAALAFIVAGIHFALSMETRFKPHGSLPAAALRNAISAARFALRRPLGRHASLQTAIAKPRLVVQQTLN